MSNTDTRSRPQTWLTPDQVDELRDACLSADVPTYLQDRDEAMIALLYDTGIRRSEAAGLDVEHVDLDRRELRLPARIQKGDARPATLDLGSWGADSTRALRRYLRDRWRESEALFPSRQSGRCSPRSISRVVTRAAERAQVEPQTPDGRGGPEDVSAHTLRHSVAYRIIRERDGRLEDVQLRLRHSARSTTDRVYSHLRRR